MNRITIAPSTAVIFNLFKDGINPRMLAVGDGDGWASLQIRVDGGWVEIQRFPPNYATILQVGCTNIRITANNNVTVMFSIYKGETYVLD